MYATACLFEFVFTVTIYNVSPVTPQCQKRDFVLSHFLLRVKFTRTPLHCQALVRIEQRLCELRKRERRV